MAFPEPSSVARQIGTTGLAAFRARRLLTAYGRCELNVVRPALQPVRHLI